MSDSSPSAVFVARLEKGSDAFNTLNLPPAVPVLFQRSPGTPTAEPRGISGLQFQVKIGGQVKQKGVTGADGKIDVRVPPGGSSLLQLLVKGAVVAEYEVSVDDAEFEAVTERKGQQQRLRMLGYQIGHGGTDGDGASDEENAEMERGLLDFQIDQAEDDHTLMADARTLKKTQDLLTKSAGS